MTRFVVEGKYGSKSFKSLVKAERVAKIEDGKLFRVEPGLFGEVWTEMVGWKKGK